MKEHAYSLCTWEFVSSHNLVLHPPPPQPLNSPPPKHLTSNKVLFRLRSLQCSLGKDTNWKVLFVGRLSNCTVTTSKVGKCSSCAPFPFPISLQAPNYPNGENSQHKVKFLFSIPLKVPFIALTKGLTKCGQLKRVSVVITKRTANCPFFYFNS